MPTTSIHATIDDAVFAPPPEHRALLSVASALFPGAQALATAQETRREALVLILGHVTECVLKSIATKSGSNSDELRKPTVRHNLVALWALAASECARLPATAPEWTCRLNGFHGFPYASRYMKDVDVYSLPPTEPMLSEITNLLVIAQSFA